MRLQYNCSSCKKGNYFKPKAATRGDLQMKLGDEVKVNCKNCGNAEKKHINKINAVVDNRMILGGLGLGLIGSIILFFMFGGLAVVTFSLPILVWINETKTVGSFNKYTIRRK